MVKDCTYKNPIGFEIEICRDKPFITYCRLCGSLYFFNPDNRKRTKINSTLKELLDYIKEKGIEK